MIKKSKKRFVLIGLGLLALLVLNMLSTQTYNLSVQLQTKYHLSQNWLVVLNNLISYSVFVVLPLNLFLTSRKAFYLGYLILTLYFMGMLKHLYHQSRPFWQSAQPYDYSCPTDYGLPSGHSWLAVLAFDFLFLQNLSPYFDKLEAIILAFVCSGAVALSRLLLNAHSLNQIILGFALGVLGILVMCRCKENECSKRQLKVGHVATTILAFASLIQFIPDQIQINRIKSICNQSPTADDFKRKLLKTTLPLHLLFGYLYEDRQVKLLLCLPGFAIGCILIQTLPVEWGFFFGGLGMGLTCKLSKILSDVK